eukprot:g24032.t1
MLENLSSELKGATPATVAAALALLSPDELQLLRDALDLLGPPKSGTVTYHISMVDGSEIEMTLSNEATVSDACLAIADQKGVRASQVNLLAAGQSQPMSKSDGQLCSATDGSTELFAILSATYDFGQPKGPLAPFCSSVTFEHFPTFAYLTEDSMDGLHAPDSLEPCDGQQVTWHSSIPAEVSTEVRAYLAAVVNEQARQRRECNNVSTILLDDEKLAEVARRISESDAIASIERAQRDYAKAGKEDPQNQECPKIVEEAVEGQDRDHREEEEQPEQDRKSPQSGSFGMKRVESITLVDREEADSDDDVSSLASGGRLPDMSKGFGLSRELLQDMGLRANGRKDDSVGQSSLQGLRPTMSAQDLQAKGYAVS